MQGNQKTLLKIHEISSQGNLGAFLSPLHSLTGWPACAFHHPMPWVLYHWLQLTFSTHRAFPTAFPFLSWLHWAGVCHIGSPKDIFRGIKAQWQFCKIFTTQLKSSICFLPYAKDFLIMTAMNKNSDTNEGPYNPEGQTDMAAMCYNWNCS